MTKERNYTIEFYRFMFAINFIIIHGLMIFPLGYLGYTLSGVNSSYYIFESSFDTILPFMIFAGFFLMNHFKKLQAKGLNEGVSPARQAWTYLKQRIIGLIGVFLLAQLLGCIANGIWRGVPASEWPVYLISCLGEFCGLQLTGIGMGNQYVGNWADALATGKPIAAVKYICNTPLWFVSGIFICGYFIYYLLAKNEKHTLAFTIPIVTLLYLGSCWITNTIPLWNNFINIAGLSINMDFILMFIGLGLGCIIWQMVDSLKGKKFTTTAKVWMTIIQLILTVLVLFRTWVPVNNEWLQKYLDWGWGPTFILTFFWCFFILLDVDWISRCPIFHSKFWKVPGQLSLYIYMIHFPILIFTALAFGLKGVTPSGPAPEGMPPIMNTLDTALRNKIFLVVGITIVASIVLGYLLMLFDTKVFRPWLAKSPWIKKEANVNAETAVVTAGAGNADANVEEVVPAKVAVKNAKKTTNLVDKPASTKAPSKKPATKTTTTKTVSKPTTKAKSKTVTNKSTATKTTSKTKNIKK